MGDGTSQSRSDIRRLLAASGLAPKKHLGQNFLTDANIVRKIADVASVDGAKVIEIGAGTGTLTSELAARAEQVVAYEVDAGLEPVLAEVVGSLGNVEVRIADATGVDFDAVLPDGHWTLVSNLPYNVGTGIVLDALRYAPRIQCMVVMVQREVADRMLARKGSKVYGIPSIVVGLHAVGHIEMSVPRQVFEPPPNVDSAVVALDRIEAPPEADRAIEIASAGFNQRRKMLRRSLATTLDDPVAILEHAGIDPTRRAEDLDPIDNVEIARAEQGWAEAAM